MNTKIDDALNLIIRARNLAHSPVVSCSFGKDSLVVLHLVRRLYPDIPALWNDTGVEYPSVRRLARRLQEEWNLQIIRAAPLCTFWTVVEKHGFPIEARNSRKPKEPDPTGKLVSPRQAAWNCCEALKKKPFAIAVAVHQIDLAYDGLTMWESKNRRFLLDTNFPKAQGPLRFNKKLQIWKCSPIASWTPPEVWQYIQENNIPYPDHYDYEMPEVSPSLTKMGIRQGNVWRAHRLGCWSCTQILDHGKLIHLRTFYPKLWKVLLEKGLGVLILKRKLGVEQADPAQVQQMMDSQPCFFDK